MSLAKSDPRHGTANGYTNLGCRCERCRRAATEYHWRNGTAGYEKDTCECGGLKRPQSKRCMGCHRRAVMAGCGTVTGYGNGCRCDLCREASARARREYRARLAEELREEERRRDRERKRAARLT